MSDLRATILLACIVACAPPHDDKAVPPSTAGTFRATAEESPQSPTRADVDAEFHWASAGRDARVMHMTFGVLVEMAELFQSFDKERYVGFTCSTCHGTDMVEVDFEMPNTLFPLDPENLPGPDSDDPREAAYARFMVHAVTPKMRELLGDDGPRDEKGCFRCHAKLQPPPI